MKTFGTSIPHTTTAVNAPSSTRSVEMKQRRLAELGRILLKIAGGAGGGAQ